MMISKGASKDPVSALSWDDLRVVKAIGDHGGPAGAAISLGVNHSTISRRLNALEEVLGVALFDRRRSGYLPTRAGAEILALSNRVEQDIFSVARQVSGAVQGASGELRIATSDSLLHVFLAPIIADFQRINPEVRVEVIVGNAPLNLARGESDIAFRATLSPPENLYGRKLARVAWAIYGHRRDYEGVEVSQPELYRRKWAAYGSSLVGLRAFKFVEQHVVAQNITFRADSVLGLAAALCAGAGIGFLPCMHGDVVPDLVRISPVEPEVYDDLWILTHPDIRKAGRVYAFMRHCAEAIARRRSFVEGREPAPGSVPEAVWERRKLG